MTTALYAVGAAATAALATLTLAGVLWRRLGRPLAAFLRDWAGEEPRSGLPLGRPGVPERLRQIEWHVGNGAEVPLRHEVHNLKQEVRAYHRAQRATSPTVPPADPA